MTEEAAQETFSRYDTAGCFPTRLIVTVGVTSAPSYFRLPQHFQ